MSAGIQVFNPSVQKVLDSLQAASDDNGACLSVKELATQTTYSESTVRRALKALAAAGAITTQQCAGDYRNGGFTNRYCVDTPLSVIGDTPLSNGVTPPVILTPTPLSNWLPFDTPLSFPVTEYAHEGAAGGRDSFAFKEQKELKELDTQQTNSLKVIVPDTPAQSEDDLKRDIESASSQVRASFPALLEKAQPAIEHEDNPPGSAEPPITSEVLDAYLARTGFTPTGKETESLEALIKLHGAAQTAILIRDSDREDRRGGRINNPAGWTLKTKPIKPAWNPKPIAPAPDYTVTEGRKALNDYLGQFIR